MEKTIFTNYYNSMRPVIYITNSLLHSNELKPPEYSPMLASALIVASASITELEK